jgi:Cys-tRNA(Pro)/Cys-tRNA(Cys) deacylase
MAKTEKTHAMRVLKAKGVAYRATAYDASGAFHSGEEAAALVGADADTVYKTLVVLRDGQPRAKPLLVMVPAPEQLTGMQAGGISALGLRKPGFEILIDERARTLPEIHISAGVRGVDVALAVADLAAVTGARFVRSAE